MKDWRTQEHVGLKVEADGHTAVVTLNNPPAHTWTVHSLSALRDLVEPMADSPRLGELISHLSVDPALAALLYRRAQERLGIRHQGIPGGGVDIGKVRQN